MNALTIDFLKEKLGGKSLGPAYDEDVPHDRVLAHIDIGSAGGVLATQVILDPSSPDGIRIYHRNERVLPVLENAVCRILGLPARHAVERPANDNKPSAAEDKPLPLIDPRDWQGKALKPRKWFVDNLIPAGVPTLLSGDGGMGKSLLALQLVAASALQVEWLGMKVAEGPCLYYGAEDTADELHRRFASIVSHYERELSDLKGVRLVCMAERDAVLSEPHGPNGGQMRATDNLKKLCEIAVELQPKLIVIDTAADAFGGDEIKRLHVRQFIATLRQIAIGMDTTILILSHPSVAGMQSGTGLSGSTAWNNSVRNRLYLKPGEHSDNSDFQTRTLSIEKANYGKKGTEIKLRWKDHVFVLDGGTDPCVAGMIEAKSEKLFLELLELFTAQCQNLGAASGKSYAPSKMMKHPKAKGLTTSAQLEGAMQRLLDKGVIKNVPFGPPSRVRYRLELAPNVDADE